MEMISTVSQPAFKKLPDSSGWAAVASGNIGAVGMSERGCNAQATHYYFFFLRGKKVSNVKEKLLFSWGFFGIGSVQ